MSLPANKTLSQVVATVLTGQSRSNALPNHFPHLFLVFENTVYDFMEKLCPSYAGAIWEFYSLSNGGFFMAPRSDKTFFIEVPFGNHFSDSLSAEAAGIVVNIFAITLLMERHNVEYLYDLYVGLRAYAGEHAEAGKILAAID